MSKKFLYTIPLLIGILLIGNSLYQQSSGQFLTGIFLFLVGISVLYFSRKEEILTKFIHDIIN